MHIFFITYIFYYIYIFHVINIFHYIRIFHYICVCLLSCVQLFATPWTIVHQAPLFMGWTFQARILEWTAISFSKVLYICVYKISLEDVGMASHSGILAWRIPHGQRNRAGCNSQRVGLDWVTKHTEHILSLLNRTQFLQPGPIHLVFFNIYILYASISSVFSTSTECDC